MSRPRRWLVTGAAGMLGSDVVAALAADGAEVTAASHADLDITDLDAVAAAVPGHDVVVNTAAWTDVDGAEQAEAAAARVNADGPAHLAAACARSDARLVHVSTDYVFSGDAREPYPEDATPAPQTAYGRTKLAGERAVLATLPHRSVVVRTAWLYGQQGRSFVATVARLAAERDTVEVVDDQWGQPTWSWQVARRLVEVARTPSLTGVLHATNAGATTWCGVARAVFEELGLDPARVRPTSTERFPRPAPRPRYSVLGHARWASTPFPPLPPWRAALRAALPAVCLPARSVEEPSR